MKDLKMILCHAVLSSAVLMIQILLIHSLSKFSNVFVLSGISNITYSSKIQEPGKVRYKVDE